MESFFQISESFFELVNFFLTWVYASDVGDAFYFVPPGTGKSVVGGEFKIMSSLWFSYDVKKICFL